MKKKQKKSNKPNWYDVTATGLAIELAMLHGMSKKEYLKLVKDVWAERCDMR